MSRKLDAIDIVKLQAEGNTREWNVYLTNAYRKRDLPGLFQTRNRLQRGMNLAVKQKLSSAKLELLFLRLQSSIENTIKKIIREKYPNPCDNPLTAKDNSEWLAVKRRRDEEYERYLKKTAY